MSENKAEIIGTIGDGQLGMMLTEAGIRMGHEMVAMGPAGPNSPASQAGARHIDGQLNDAAALRQLAEACDVITPEIEHFNVPAAIKLEAEGYNFQPTMSSFPTIVDKFLQHQHYSDRHLPTAPFTRLDDGVDLARARDEFGDIIIKARTGGYDGRGNLVDDSKYSWEDVKRELADKDGNTPPLYAEQMIPFQRELAVIGARDKDGNIVLFPVVETQHVNNICNIVIAPARIEAKVARDAALLGRAAIESVEGRGIFAVELYQHERDDSVLINEMAPRVHNSGHWSIEGAETPQFEQHNRAIVGAELGSTAMTAPVAVMINVLGTREGEFDRTTLTRLAAGNIFPHDYGKSLRAARKVGHITVLGDNLDVALHLASEARSRVVA